MSQILPITPKEAKEGFSSSIPDFVIQSFNKLLTQKYSSSSITIYQDEVIEEILNNTPEGQSYSREQIYKNKWLDVERVFKKSGWKVDYESPGYNESGRSYFTFKAK